MSTIFDISANETVATLITLNFTVADAGLNPGLETTNVVHGTDADKTNIRTVWNNNSSRLSDSYKIIAAMNETNVTIGDIMNTTGLSFNDVSKYLSSGMEMYIPNDETGISNYDKYDCTPVGILSEALNMSGWNGWVSWNNAKPDIKFSFPKYILPGMQNPRDFKINFYKRFGPNGAPEPVLYGEVTLRKTFSVIEPEYVYNCTYHDRAETSATIEVWMSSYEHTLKKFNDSEVTNKDYTVPFIKETETVFINLPSVKDSSIKLDFRLVNGVNTLTLSPSQEEHSISAWWDVSHNSMAIASISNTFHIKRFYVETITGLVFNYTTVNGVKYKYISANTTVNGLITYYAKVLGTTLTDTEATALLEAAKVQQPVNPNPENLVLPDYSSLQLIRNTNASDIQSELTNKGYYAISGKIIQLSCSWFAGIFGTYTTDTTDKQIRVEIEITPSQKYMTDGGQATSTSCFIHNITAGPVNHKILSAGSIKTVSKQKPNKLILYHTINPSIDFDISAQPENRFYAFTIIFDNIAPWTGGTMPVTEAWSYDIKIYDMTVVNTDTDTGNDIGGDTTIQPPSDTDDIPTFVTPFIPLLTELTKSTSFVKSYDLKLSRFTPLDHEALFLKATKKFTAAGSKTPLVLTGEQASLLSIQMKKLESKFQALYDLVLEVQNHLNSLVNISATDGTNIISNILLFKSATAISNVSKSKITEIYSILSDAKKATLDKCLDDYIVAYNLLIKEEDTDKDGLNDFLLKLVAFEPGILATTKTFLTNFILPNKTFIANSKKYVELFSNACGLLDIFDDSSDYISAASSVPMSSLPPIVIDPIDNTNSTVTSDTGGSETGGSETGGNGIIPQDPYSAANMLILSVADSFAYNTAKEGSSFTLVLASAIVNPQYEGDLGVITITKFENTGGAIANSEMGSYAIVNNTVVFTGSTQRGFVPGGSSLIEFIRLGSFTIEASYTGSTTVIPEVTSIDPETSEKKVIKPEETIIIDPGTVTRYGVDVMIGITISPPPISNASISYGGYKLNTDSSQQNLTINLGNTRQPTCTSFLLGPPPDYTISDRRDATEAERQDLLNYMETQYPGFKEYYY